MPISTGSDCKSPLSDRRTQNYGLHNKGQLTLSSITDDDVRYGYVLFKLKSRQAHEIKDIITNPPSINKYLAIKNALIQRLTDSQEQQIRQLEGEEIGDRKPSQFLRFGIPFCFAYAWCIGGMPCARR